MTEIKEISKRRFDAFVYTRLPRIRVISKEVAWFEAFHGKLLATIALDRTDNDYGFVILGRDGRNLFRCIEVCTIFYKTVELARRKLFKELRKYKNDNQNNYPQGDETETPKDLLTPILSNDELHPYFRLLISEPRFEAARNIIREIAYSFKDPDGNYIRDFQTAGFDSRLWELYLHVYLYAAGFEMTRNHHAPDFLCNYFGDDIAIEAVTVNPSQNPQRPDPPRPNNESEMHDLRRDYLPIKYGSALFSKLQKKYYELPHVAGKPFIIAIHDFHMPGSMTWTRSALGDYLYGQRDLLIIENGKKRKIVEKIDFHEWQGKKIPSFFFKQPDSENVSAVLFTNACTITKFNRMGRLAGLGSKGVILFRKGYLYDPHPDSLEPIPFAIDVDSPDYIESWSDSLTMFHNPNARIPLDPDCFPDISHLWYDEKTDSFFGRTVPYDVLSSITIAITEKNDEEEL